MGGINKKIGILTFHQCHNVGAMLGAFALQESVIKAGYDVEFINNISPTYIEHGKKASHNLYRRTDDMGIALREQNKAELEGRWNKFESFFNSQLYLSQEIETENDLINQLKNYGTILVGGDQLWNRNLEVAGNIYYIPYETDVPRIAFGTSMGDASDIKTENLKWLRKFNYIAVREKAAAEYLETVIAHEIKVVPDNIFLLDQKEWGNITVRSKMDNYLFAYIFCKNKDIFMDQLCEIDQLSKRSGKTAVVCATEAWEGMDNLVSVIDMGPMEWLGYISGADLVITNSFHGVAFSLAFEKQFICLDTDGRKENLLKDYGLTDRLSRQPLDYVKLGKIDYQHTNDQISKKRVDAISFLAKALNKCNGGKL